MIIIISPPNDPRFPCSKHSAVVGIMNVSSHSWCKANIRYPKTLLHAFRNLQSIAAFTETGVNLTWGYNVISNALGSQAQQGGLIIT